MLTIPRVALHIFIAIGLALCAWDATGDAPKAFPDRAGLAMAIAALYLRGLDRDRTSDYE